MNLQDRTYSEKQFKEFEKGFIREFPEIHKAIKENLGAYGSMSPILFALYESSIFDQVMG